MGTRARRLTRRVRAGSIAPRLAIVVCAAALILQSLVPQPVAAIPAQPTTNADPQPAAREPVYVTEAQPAPILVDRPGGDGGDAVGTIPDVPLRTPLVRIPPPATRTELPEEREERSRVIAEPTGEYTLELADSRLNYLDPQGAWQPMDLSLVPDGEGYDLRVAASDRTVRFGLADAETRLAEISLDGRVYGLRAIGYGAGRQEADQLVYDGAGLDGDLRVRPTDYGFGFSIELASASQSPIYSFAIDRAGLEVELAADGQSVLFYEAVDPVLRFRPGAGERVRVGAIDAPLLLEGPRERADGLPVRVFLTPADAPAPPPGVSPDALASLAADEVLLTYAIDPVWLADRARAFPVLLDPTACIGDGASGCDINDNTGSFDEFIFDANPSSHASGWTVVRTGYDNRSSDGGVYGKLRSLFYFPNVALPDGAIVTDATVKLTIDNVYNNPVGQNLRFYRITRPWATNSVSWNDMTVPTDGWDAGSASPTLAVPAGAGGGTTMTFDVGAIARSWYTRRGADWKADLGMMLRFVNEGASYGEVTFRKASAGTAGHRPLLTVTYLLPKLGINFAPELGPTYAPSQMVAGQVTKLPVQVTNSSSFHFTVGTYDLGYRWFDRTAALVGSGTQDVAAINSGTTSATISLNVTPPATPGPYTLRLDMVHTASGSNVFFSDFASPSLYLARNKAILSADNTRWVGSSNIERDEFGISVVTGGGTNAGEIRSVALADGSSVGINLNAKSLRFEGAGGVGFGDRGPAVAISYGYDSANTTDCTGILKACGWFTTYDERFVPTSTDGDYTYQGTSGNRYFISTDGNGQLVGGAPVLIERQRATYFDETTLNWTVGTPPIYSTAQAFVGTHSLRITNTASGTAATGPVAVFLANDPLVSVAIKSTGTDKAALGFQIIDNASGTSTWYFYTFGASSWSVPGQVSHYISGSSLTSWYELVRQDLYTDARADIAGLSKNLTVRTIDLRGASGATGNLYYDALRFQGKANPTPVFDDAAPSWTSGSGLASLNSADKTVGAKSIQVEEGLISASPTCAGCLTTDLTRYAFVEWDWKKVGGTTIANIFNVSDARTGATGTLTYYAGAMPPGAVNPVRVSPTLPTDWTHVTRNVLEDARQILGFYFDNPLGSDPNVPPAGPTPDDVTLTGFALAALDGNFALFDFERAMTKPVPGGSGSAADDLIVTYPNREQHFFNLDGLLERIVDADGNTVDLEWSYDATLPGAAGYTLAAIHAAADATSSGGNTYERQLSVARSGPSGGFYKVSFTEVLGTTASSTGRSTEFYVASTTSSGADTWGVGDLIKVSAARHGGTTCPGSRPSGCLEFDYSSTTNHRIDEMRDARWDGTTSGSNDYRHAVIWNGTVPEAINDRSIGARQLQVVSYDDTRSSPVSKRVTYQDAAARIAGYAITEDLSTEGSLLTRYIRKACSGTCAYGDAGTYPSSPLATEITESHVFDGLSRVSGVTTYRCPGVAYNAGTGYGVSGCGGTTPLATVSRQGSNAAAKVDTYADPLAGSEVLWTQTADQHFASLADSGGTNPDLYRTELAYDGQHQPITHDELAANRRPDYFAAVLNGGAAPLAYWRLDEAAGASSATDSSGNGYTGTYTSVTKNEPGALLRSSSTSASFSGSSSKMTASLNIPSSLYTLEAWVKRDSGGGQTSKGLAGDYAGTSGAQLWLNAAGRISLRHKTTQLDSGILPAVGRWYHVAGTWSGGWLRLYVDGKVVAVAYDAAAPGSGASSFELATFDSGGYFDGWLDDVAVYDTPLDGNQVLQHYLAGRAIAQRSTTTLYDAEGHPLQSDDNFVTNGGFESSLWSWRSSGAGAALATAPVKSGFYAVDLSTAAYVRQDTQLLPGQTFRLQFAARDTGSQSHATWTLSYWRTSTAAWVNLTTGDVDNSSAWETKAFDVTVPLDSDGRVRLKFSNGGTGGNAYIDDALIVTAWGTSTWNATGQLTDAYTLQPGSATAATLRQNTAYAANATHPAIYPTTSVANYIDGVYSDTNRDNDLVTTRTFDAWGHGLTTTDPDGVTATSHYVTTTSANGFGTDLDWREDELGNHTAFAYDLHGRQTSVTSPLGMVTTTAYDLAEHPTLVTAPDGVKTASTYTTANQLAATFANYVNGAPSNGDDDVQTSYAYDPYGRTVSTIADDGAHSQAIGARTIATFDLLGNPVATTVYGTFDPATDTWGEARTTTNYFATISDGSATYSRTAASGQRLPIAPSGSPAALCPGTGSTYCNQVNLLDLAGRVWQATDTYGKLTVTDTDLAGHPVQTIANYVAGGGSSADQNVTAVALFDIAGRTATSIDVMGRVTISAYDDVDRPTKQTSQDPPGTDYAFAKTVYLPSGRVERVSAPAAAETADSALTWTKTEYDAAGRAIRTLEHVDLDADAHLRLDGFETGSDGWSGADSGHFTDGTATLSLGGPWASTSPKTGNDRLRISTSGGTANSGAWWDLSGQTFEAGRTYHLHADLLVPAGSSVQALLGVDAAGGNNQTSSTIAGSGAWTTVDLDWTPSNTVSSNVHAALRKTTSGSVAIYLDNVAVWDTAAADRDIPTETAYDADGRITTSVLPPGVPGGAPMVSTTAYDRAGRPVSVSANATRSYSHAILAESGLVAYWPLDEATGTSAEDQQGTLDGTYTAGYRLGLAGGVDENRTSVNLDGATAYVTKSDDAALDFSSAMSLEAWFKSDELLNSSDPASAWYGGIQKSGAYQLGWTTNITDGGWRFRITAGGQTYNVDSPTNTPAEPGRWYHLVGTYDGSALKLYLDGVEVGSNSVGVLTITNSANALRFGQIDSTYWAGDIDEVSVWSSALNATKVGNHYAAGRPASADGSLTTRSEYDLLGRPVLVTSPRGIRTSQTVDRLGRTTQTIANYRNAAPGMAVNADDVTASYAYDAVDELIGTCLPLAFEASCDPADAADGLAWHASFDAMGHQVTEVPPDNQTLTDLNTSRWVYDAGGRLSKACDHAAGGASCGSATRHTDYAYDNLGRALTEEVHDGSGTDLKLKWTNTYNPDGSLASVAFDGTGSSPSQGTDTLTFTYDGLGRPDQVKRSATVLTDYGWNADGALASRVDGTLGTANFGYDWASRLTSMTSPLWTGSLAWTWRLDGLLASRSWPVGAGGAASLTYDAAKRPLSFSKAGTAAGSFSQTYDRDGNVLTEARSLTGVSGDAGTNTQTFTYDGLNRVSGATGVNGGAGYVYDHDSNRTAASIAAGSTAYTFDRAGQLISRVDGGTTTYYTYSKYGNLTSAASGISQTTAYAYDTADRLTSITPPGAGATTFTFDALGRHLTRVTGGVTDTYSYVGTSETVWSLVNAVTTLAGITPDGSRVAIKSGSTVGFSLADLHANTAAAVNSGETAYLSATRYDPYGQTAATYDSGGSFPRPWGFQGRLDLSPVSADPLYDMSARFYNPAIGAFTQLDTYAGDAADPLSLNRYLYVGANPWTFTDPTGHFRPPVNELGGPGAVPNEEQTPSGSGTSIPAPSGSPGSDPESTPTPTSDGGFSLPDLSWIVPCDPWTAGIGLGQTAIGSLAVAGAVVTEGGTLGIGTGVAIAEGAFGLYHIFEGQVKLYEAYHCD